MSDRDRQNQYGREQRPGEYGGNDTHNSSRQQNQYAEGVRQQGSDWQNHRGGGQQGSSYESGYQGSHQAPQQFEDTRYRGQQDRGAQDYRSGASSYERSSYDAGQGSAFSSFTGNDYGGRDFSSNRGARASAGNYGSGSAYGQRSTYETTGRNFYDSGSRDRSQQDYDTWRSFGEDRGFFARAGDEIASWFGDEDAARRREQDHRGRGPSNYKRSDERIREDVNDRLTNDWGIDARKITVSVNEGEVTLDGTVDSRHAKRRAEDVADDISGVKHVQNNLRVENVREGTPSIPSSGIGTTAETSDTKNATTPRA